MFFKVRMIVSGIFITTGKNEKDSDYSGFSMWCMATAQFLMLRKEVG